MDKELSIVVMHKRVGLAAGACAIHSTLIGYSNIQCHILAGCDGAYCSRPFKSWMYVCISRNYSGQARTGKFNLASTAMLIIVSN